MVITEIFVQEDGYVLIVWISFYLIVWSAGEGVCSVGCPWFIFKLNIVLGNFRDISHYVWSNFSGFPIVSQVCVICVYQDRNFGSFKQVGPASQTSKDS
jgi:hypothetical protein